ncbi:MAG TPA: tetratricopeptide repeat protein [Candidatus Acidoferrales bacterium]
MRNRVMWGLLAMALAAAGVVAQGSGRIDGEVRDGEGKPFMGVVVVATHEETNHTVETKTDKNGLFVLAGLRSGIYVLEYKVKDQVVFRERKRLITGAEERTHVNFKEILAQQSAAQAEAAKKAQEVAQKFQSLKQHFDAGRAALDQAKGVRAEMQRLPADQRQAKADQANTLLATAIGEFENAQKVADAKDTNLHLILANLGEAYDAAGRYKEAAAAYQGAIALKPDQSNYYVNMSTAAARAGDIEGASAACEKIAALEPSNAAMCWRNLGIVYYNTNRAKDAIEPFQKAAALDPKNADQWYLLGAALVAGMEYKNEGGTIKTIVLPGTAEAYQKYLELAPNGRFAEEAKAGLAMLETLGAGIQTKVRTGRKKG